MNRDEQAQILNVIDQAVRHGPGATLPGFDVEADAIIRAMFVRNPEAAYRVTMLAVEQTRELLHLRTQIAELVRRRNAGWLGRLFRGRGDESAARGQET